MSQPIAEDSQDLGVVDTELTIESLVTGGRGLARLDGKVWFVIGGLPGDRVLARPVRETERFIEARAVSIVEASPQRRSPACGLQPRCGGCPWMPLDEFEQRRWKTKLVADALVRLGGVEDPVIDPIQGMGPELGYRNKVELSLGLDAAGKPAIGFHGVDPSAGLVDVDRCHVQSDLANKVLVTARRLLLSSGKRVIFDGSFRLVLRTAGEEKVLCAIRESSEPFPDAKDFAAALCARHPEVVGVVRIKGRSDRRGGSRTIVIRGKDMVRQRIAGIKFVLPAATFTQVNPAVGGRLTRHVVDVCGGAKGKKVFDLYGGVGVLGLSLAGKAASVTVCEADNEAVRCGREAARNHGIRNATFVHANVRKFLNETSERADLVVANPPREGFGPGVAKAIAARKPARILIVSCDPPTMARDVKLLIGRGYKIDRVTPFEMFPQTAHVETVVRLSRVPAGSTEA